MTTYTIDRADYPCLAAVAERIRGLVADGYGVEVTAAGAVLYRVDPFPGVTTDGGPAFWLKDARGRTVGTIADVNALVRYAGAMQRRAAG